MDQEFFDKALIKPYQRGIAAMEIARTAARTDYRALLSENKPIRKRLMNLMNFNEIWGSQFETAKIEKIIKDFTPVSNFAVLLISKIFIQVGPLTPQS